MTASAPNNLVVGFFVDEANSGTYTAVTPGFTTLVNAVGFNAGVIDDTGAAPGNYDPTATENWGADNCWVGTGAVFVGQ
jgi:hypothetical protein